MSIKEKILIVLFLIVIGSLRFINLGYSEYIPDEGAVLTYLKDNGSYSIDFLLNERKGPMQYLVSLIVYTLGVDIFNELGYRIPFAIANTLSILFLYLFIRNVTKSSITAGVTALLFGVNGFIVGFGRVVQYQNINILFSFISLYLFSSKKFTWGTLFFCLSLLSHWDAVFILPMILYLVFKDFDFKKVIYSFIVGCVVLLPYLIPYTINYVNNNDNQEYFSSRLGMHTVEFNEKVKDYRKSIELYNPFIFIEVVGVLLILAIFSIKKDWIYFVWSLSLVLIFWFLVSKPGTHVYNVFIPISILCGIGFNNLFKIFPKYTKLIPIFGILIVLSFLYYQSYQLLVDHTIAYPWNQKQVWKYTTREYSASSLPNNVIGFPIYSGWEEVNKFLISYDPNLKYITNEDKSISSFYIDLSYSEKKKRPYYAVGVKDPLNFVTDYKFSQIRNKGTIHKLEDTSVRIYLVREENE